MEVLSTRLSLHYRSPSAFTCKEASHRDQDCSQEDRERIWLMNYVLIRLLLVIDGYERPYASQGLCGHMVGFDAL